MWCRDLSTVVVSEPGVPDVFSASLEAGQGRVHFQILCQRLVLWHGLCRSRLLQCSHSLAGSCRVFLGYQVGDTPHFTLSYRTRSHLEFINCQNIVVICVKICSVWRSVSCPWSSHCGRCLGRTADRDQHLRQGLAHLWESSLDKVLGAWQDPPVNRVISDLVLWGNPMEISPLWTATVEMWYFDQGSNRWWTSMHLIFFPYLVLIISLFKSILLNQPYFKIKAWSNQDLSKWLELGVCCCNVGIPGQYLEVSLLKWGWLMSFLHVKRKLP